MLHPVAGLNPWLENPEWWRGLHQRLIVALADDTHYVMSP
jgi:hypothetical protein